MQLFDPVRFNAAAGRFAAFFGELVRTFVEREDVIAQVALGLLCREHVLLTGPPGTAKSQLASAVFSRIVDEKTGRPSLYARQFTESTVQTDLVGPIDFKTLMETGRTEHFTDEGILGAVHAFLDEVFDGRDNLLRSALNVLHERELKQGTKTTRGAVECALMTSNRYISDVLERSRETLLAFVDRIAFVGFVPRGFADPDNLGAVLRRHVGAAHRPLLDAPLSIQDLDVLQAAVDDVVVVDEMCTGLAQLLANLDVELAAAVRADPTFVPTRYLSTRTAVRCGRVLRALCVYDRIFRDPSRDFAALPQDLAGLRLHLLLGGPSPEQAKLLMTRETDAHERRQLTILQTEREVFARAWEKLPAIDVKKSAVRKAARRRDADERPRSEGATQAAAPSPVDSAVEAVERAVGNGSVDAVVEALKVVAGLARGEGDEPARAARATQRAVAFLGGRALHAVVGATGEADARAVAAELAALATSIEPGPAETKALARWIRGAALELVDAAAAHAPGAAEAHLEAALSDVDSSALLARLEARLDALGELAELRGGLVAAGGAPKDGSDDRWRGAVEAAEDDLAALWDVAFRSRVAQALEHTPADRLPDVLDALAPELDRIDRAAARLERFAARPSALKAKVVGARIGTVVGALVERLDGARRGALVAQVRALREVLTKAGLGGVVAPSTWLAWTASALVKSERAPRSAEGPFDHDGYRRLRSAEHLAACATVLSEVALVVAPELGAMATRESLDPVARLVAEIPAPFRDELARRDLGRVERAVGYLEAWWARIDGEVALRGPDERLGALVRSRFYGVLLDEAAPLRFTLEARLVGALFADHQTSAEGLCARLSTLEARARRTALDAVRARSDAAWAATLAPTAATEAGPRSDSPAPAR